MSGVKLTKAQWAALARISASGFEEHHRFGASISNKPLWRLVELEFADFGFGPPGSFLQTQGFMPTLAGRAVLEKDQS